MNGHPLDDFLKARLRVIDWMRSEGHTVQQIRVALSMHDTQVVLLMLTIDDYKRNGLTADGERPGDQGTKA